LMQDKDASLMHLMRQTRNDSLCVLAHRQASLLCNSLLKRGEPGGIPGGITIPLDTSSWTENLTMLGTLMPKGKIEELVSKKIYVSQSPVSTQMLSSALVIGNEKYESVSQLSGAARDARAIAKTLRALGVSVTEKQNLAGAQILEAVADFAKSLANTGQRALVYYAGHGFQIKGHNVLAGIDIKTSYLAPGVVHKDNEITKGVAPLTEILNDALGELSQIALIIDACRDDPFANCRGLGKPLETTSLAIPTVGIVENLISAKPRFASLNPEEVISCQSRGQYGQAGSSAMVKDFFTLFTSSPAECAADKVSYTQTLIEELKSVEQLRDLEHVTMRASHTFVAKQGAWSPPENGKQNKQVPWSLSILLSGLHLPLCTPEVQKNIDEEQHKDTGTFIKSQMKSLPPDKQKQLLEQLLANLAGSEPTPKIQKVN